jgi:hypothetical protein
MNENKQYSGLKMSSVETRTAHSQTVVLHFQEIILYLNNNYL